MSARPFSEYRDTPLWAAIEGIVTDLVASRELSMNTASEYVVGYLCRELVSKKLIVPAGYER